MKFVRNTDIRTDDTGRAVIQHEALRPPILFFYDEIEKYSQGEIKWHWHFEMEFILVRDNPVEVYVEDRRIVLRKGEGIWINANKMHMVRRVDGIPSASLFTILFLPEFIATRTDVVYQKYVHPWLSDPELCHVLLLDSVPWHQETVDLLTRAFLTQSEQGFAHELSVHNDICTAWLTILRHQKEVPRQAASGAEFSSQERIGAMAAFIYKNYAEHLTLAQIADAAHVSRSEAIRCFKKNLDITPIQFLTEYRIERAAQLLLSTSEPISRIAEMCGFDDVSYFTKQFRQIQNVTPSKYRKNNGLTELTAGKKKL